MYFIQALENPAFGEKKTSILLGLINICAKYRFIFVEPESPLSLWSFQYTIRRDPPRMIQEKVRQLNRELLLIEDESRILQLDTPGAIYTYTQGIDPDRILEFQQEWYRERQNLMDAANAILHANPDSNDFANCFENWLSALKAFSEMSHKVNSTIAIQALENLKESFQ
jgi:hypothetical protein